MIAIDGKSARSTRGRDGRAVHLLAAFGQASGVRPGPDRGGWHDHISAFAPLLDRIDTTGAIITAYALHTQHRHADYLIGRGAHYVLTMNAESVQENRLHWIRDVVFAEDHNQICTGAGPAVMATLRSLAVSLHSLTGAPNIAARSAPTCRPHANPILSVPPPSLDPNAGYLVSVLRR